MCNVLHSARADKPFLQHSRTGRVVCVFVLLCVLFLPTYLVVYFIFVYNFTDHCHTVETQQQLINILWFYVWGQDGSVGIATRYGLDGPGIESLWGEGARFSASVQTGPVAHPASDTMGTGFSRG